MSQRIYMRPLAQAILEAIAYWNAQAEARERIAEQERERLRQQAWDMGNTTREASQA